MQRAKTGELAVTETESRPRNRALVASFLFIDLVGYSKGTAADQYAEKAALSEILAQNLAALRKDDYRVKDTGDGALIAFLPTPSMRSTWRSRSGRTFADRRRAAGFPSNSLRTGLHIGAVKEALDLEARPNFVGDGINAAKRIMDFAAPGKSRRRARTSRPCHGSIRHTRRCSSISARRMTSTAGRTSSTRSRRAWPSWKDSARSQPRTGHERSRSATRNPLVRTGERSTARAIRTPASGRLGGTRRWFVARRRIGVRPCSQRSTWNASRESGWRDIAVLRRHGEPPHPPRPVNPHRNTDRSRCRCAGSPNPLRPTCSLRPPLRRSLMRPASAAAARRRPNANARFRARARDDASRLRTPRLSGADASGSRARRHPRPLRRPSGQRSARCQHIMEKATLGESLSQDEKRELASSCR